ncbi:MAG: serine/threonine protein kinase [Bdellovibrionota bacterium]|jgi:Ser/Thr protein kinase RdoA (MazF antagonist)|nr:serine/threonine protein kinase [Bdellovibrionota bacterium]
MNSLWGSGETEFFYQLDPTTILNYIDKLGLRTTGRCLPLNSLENRVYEIEIENEEAKSPSERFVIAKFYRPGRWSKDQIKEEHQFLFDLEEAEVPVIAPMRFDGESVFETEGATLYYTLFPKRGGRNPDELNDQMARDLGRLIGRMHSVGRRRPFEHRLKLNPEVYGSANLEGLLKTDLIPKDFKDSYQALATQFIDLITPLFKNIETQRVHGDCHWGNLLYSEDQGFFFIDFDDNVTGPVVQDLWLMIPGRDEYAQRQRQLFVDSYALWGDFPMGQLKLIEPLRGLRYLHFDHWIAKRWQDPAFPQAFPHFNSPRYWGEKINDLREQIELCQYLNDPYPYY